MDQQREQASQIAHEFIVYQESEQADIDAKDHQFDALCPSLEVITIFFRTTFKPFFSICRFYRLFLYF